MRLASFINNFLEPFSYLIYTVSFLLVNRRDKTFKRKVLLVYYIIAPPLMFYACLIALDVKSNNNLIYNLHNCLYAVVLYYYFHETLNSSLKKKIIKCLIVGDILYFVIKDVFLGQYSLYDSIGNSIFYLGIVVLSFMYFHQLLGNAKEYNILLEFDFWLICGFLLYFLGSFFVILTYNYFAHDAAAAQRKELAYLWGVQNMLLFLGSLITLSGNLWITYQKKLQ
jgi:hypothetical protein